MWGGGGGRGDLDAGIRAVGSSVGRRDRPRRVVVDAGIGREVWKVSTAHRGDDVAVFLYGSSTLAPRGIRETEMLHRYDEFAKH